MKKTIILTLILLSNSFPVFAWDNPSPLETIGESRQRHSAENYQYYQNNNNQAPLGGYPEKINDPAPRGTYYPGYNSSTNDYENSGSRGQFNNSSSRGTFNNW